MTSRDYVKVDMSEQKQLHSLEYGQIFIKDIFLCTLLDPETGLFDPTLIPENHTPCFCFNTNDIMFVGLFDRVQPVRKISVNIIQL